MKISIAVFVRHVIKKCIILRERVAQIDEGRLDSETIAIDPRVKHLHPGAIAFERIPNGTKFVANCFIKCVVAALLCP